MNELFADILANPSAHSIHSQFVPFLQSSPALVQALSRVSEWPSWRLCLMRLSRPNDRIVLSRAGVSVSYLQISITDMKGPSIITGRVGVQFCGRSITLME